MAFATNRWALLDRVDHSMEDVTGKNHGLKLNGEDRTVTSILVFFKILFCQYLKKYPYWLAATFLGIAISVLYHCYIPLLFTQLFNEILPHKQIGQLITMLVILGLGYVVLLVAEVALSLIAAVLSTKTTNYLRFKAFKKVQYFDFSQGRDEFENKVLTYFSHDMSILSHVITYITGAFVKYAIMCVIGIGLLIYFDWQLTLLTALVMPATFYIHRHFTRSANDQVKIQEEMEANLLTSVQEAMALQQVIHILLLKGYKRRHFKQKLLQVIPANYKYAANMGLSTKAAYLCMTFIKLVILSVGCYLIIIDYLTVGGLVGYILLLDSVNSAISALSNQYPLLKRGASALQNITKLLAEPSKLFSESATQKLPPFSKSIRFIDVGYQVKGKQILANINLEIRAGQAVAFVGPSGSGKSTLLRLLLQELRPTSGRIMIDDVDLQLISSKSLLSQLGVVMQQPMLFQASIAENICLGKRDATETEMIEAAKQAEIHAEILQLPQQYATQIGRRNSGLSGGQTQRVAIARMLIANPSILCLDEATSALDPLNATSIEQTIFKMAKKHTIITITHRLSTVVKMDKIFVLKEGSLVEAGQHDLLLDNKNLYWQLWHKQQGFVYTPTTGQAQVIPQWLKMIPLFESLELESLDKLAGEFSIEHADADSTVFKQGELGEKLYLLVAGIVEIVRIDSQGREKILAKLTDGDFFGEIAILQTTPRTATVKTKAVCVFLTLHASSFHKIFATLPQTTQHLLLSKAHERSTNNI